MNISGLFLKLLGILNFYIGIFNEYFRIILWILLESAFTVHFKDSKNACSEGTMKLCDVSTSDIRINKAIDKTGGRLVSTSQVSLLGIAKTRFHKLKSVEFYQ